MKKKTICIVGLIIILLICFGIFHYKKIVCKDTIKEDNYTINNKYTIYYKKNYVKKVIITKEISSKNNTILDFFENNTKDEFNGYNKKYGGYKISSSKDKNKITVNIVFNMKDVDIKELKSNNSYLKDNIKNNKLEVDGVYKLFSLDKNKCSK